MQHEAVLRFAEHLHAHQHRDARRRGRRPQNMLKSSGMPHIRVRRKPVIYQYMGFSLMICCMLKPPMEKVIWVGS